MQGVSSAQLLFPPSLPQACCPNQFLSHPRDQITEGGGCRWEQRADRRCCPRLRHELPGMRGRGRDREWRALRGETRDKGARWEARHDGGGPRRAQWAQREAEAAGKGVGLLWSTGRHRWVALLGGGGKGRLEERCSEVPTCGPEAGLTHLLCLARMAFWL